MTTTDMIVDEAERLQARVREMEAALRDARIFIEYARYELQPVLVSGSQFPSQACADKMLATIDAALTPSEPRR